MYLQLCACLLTLAAVPLAEMDENLLRKGDIGAGAAWRSTGGGEQTEFRVDRKLGAQKKGSLSISNTDELDQTAHNWFQRAELGDRPPARLKLSAQVRLGVGGGPQPGPT